ncbi:RNA polymerase sigma-70 factor [Galbibacter sp. EGI 63066]|uniref:RNA polymerase sigma factor n=1 Tax=Galbibacter sp. EGI 63066 TaxID=2993559 RepID=UPI002248785D|nr:RNA polymerase sigma-70 factor [Galbibacter sp. EGI 63066]MCX2680981.1 RNA polymerase sigma-70 factor [Galbibacter sp. EGI 63066]
MENKRTYKDVPASVLWQLKKGDPRAFDTLYHTYKGRLYGNLLKMVKSGEIAKELLQEVFVRVWQKRHKIDPEKPVRAYLFRIAGNMAIDFFRKVARDRKLQAELTAAASAHYTHIEEELYHKDTVEYLDLAIENLPSKRRRIFQLVKLEGKTYEEVGKMLDISTSTVNDHIVKATRTVREYLVLKGDLAGVFIALLLSDL